MPETLPEQTGLSGFVHSAGILQKHIQLSLVNPESMLVTWLTNGYVSSVWKIINLAGLCCIREYPVDTHVRDNPHRWSPDVEPFKGTWSFVLGLPIYGQ
jgi:hypothetical protein